MTTRKESRLSDEPLWYRDAVIYELRVRSFCDSDGDGIGDFRGLTEKLDYLQELGVTALWLLPFYPSPLRDDGYDISDYTAIHPDCGDMRDFRTFLKEAHRRGLRVVTELVLNHSSEQHPWFQQARRAPAGSRRRDFYVWSDTPDRYPEARIIFQDFETSNWTWDPVAKAYYWHRFYSHQPDLNFHHPAVKKAMFGVLDFWLEMGVDGLRLDAVPYLFERDGTSGENLPETHEFLRELRRHVDRKFKNRMLLAEANQWPEDAVAYLAEGKECHMAYHFPLMPRMFMAIRVEDRFPLTDIWAQTPPIHESCQWGLFLRNHDELTLEMVTDEERDYMYRAYARDERMRINLGIRRRLAPLLGNNRRTIELMNGLLFSLPGTPVLYYGDEIGMGDNVYLGDRDGVRTPMQWSGDRNAGYSRANPQQLVLPVIIDHEYHYQTVNVEAQESNRHSLLWWMRRLIALRKQFQAFGRGSIEFLSLENPRILAFIRSHQEERILVLANLSRFVQYVEMDLSRFKGMVPVELSGRTPMPKIGELPYFLTLGPHAFYWFSVEQARDAEGRLEAGEREAPVLELGEAWSGALRGESRALLEEVLPEYLAGRRWFGSKARTIRSTRISDLLPVVEGASKGYLALVNVDYEDGEPDTYLLTLGVAAGEAARDIRSRFPDSLIAELRRKGREEMAGLVFDALADPAFCRALLEIVDRRRRLKGPAGEARVSSTRGYRTLRGAKDDPCEPRALKAEQSNSSLVYGDRLILKLFRHLDEGVNPELEMGRFLTERASFPHTPPLAAWIDYQAGRDEPRTVAVVQGFVPNQGDAWQLTREELRRYYERAAARRDRMPPAPDRPLIEVLAEAQIPPPAENAIGGYLDTAHLLGERIAEMHLALSSDPDDPEFAPEPYPNHHQRSIYQSMRNQAGQVFRLLRNRLSSLPEDQRKPVQKLLADPERVVGRFEVFLKRRITAHRIRCHGDLHLGQILHTGKDFLIIDFEGEPARPLAERRRRRLALRDVAGMLRSFHYAAFATLREQLGSGALGESDFPVAEPWAAAWQAWTSWSFLRGYLETSGKARFLPRERGELNVLLDAYLLEKALYELGYELNNRPDWLRIPLHGIEQILGVENENEG